MHACGCVMLAIVVATGCDADRAQRFTHGSTVRNATWMRTPRDERVTVVALGDSITAGLPLWYPGADRRQGVLRRRIPDLDERSQWMYWAARKHPSITFRNCGSPSDLSLEVAGRLDRCTKRSDAVVIQCGTNDVAFGTQDDGDTIATIDQMIRRADAAGLVVQVADIPPNDRFTKSQVARVLELNERIRALGRQHGVQVLPFHETLADPKRAGRFRAGLTDDGIHPTIEGYRLLGERAFAPPA